MRSVRKLALNSRDVAQLPGAVGAGSAGAGESCRCWGFLYGAQQRLPHGAL